MVLSGERYKYPLAVVKALTEKFGFNINIMYDIGCRFKPALFAKFPELERAGSQVAVGVFHSYAHSMSCQVKNNPRYLKGAGLLDGEGLERLWSYLGGFVSITRQMSSKRRLLTLSHALAHFKAKRIASMPTTLKKRTKRAISVVSESSEILLKEYPNLTDTELSQQWLVFAATVAPSGSSAYTGVSNEALEIQYAKLLKELYTLAGNRSFDDIAATDPSFRNKKKNLESLERTLRSRNIITDRWENDDEAYTAAYRKGLNRDLDDIKSQLRSLIVGRTMLEDLSHRQGNGHKVTMKFKAALNSVKDKAKPLLKRYDDIDEELTGERVNRKYEKIIDLKDSFWVTSSAGLDFRALRAYMNKCRAEEELIVLEKEERRVRNYSKQRCESLEIAIMNNDRSAGEKILLYHRLLDAELLYRKAHGAQRTRGETFVVPGQPPKLMQTFGDDEDLGDDVLDDRQGRKENGDDDVEDVDDAEDDDDDFEDEEPVAYVHADEAT